MRSIRRILAAAAIAFCALLSACATPLGPGYTIKKQQYDVRWTGPDDLLVHGEYHLQNTGNQPLDYIEVTLPAEPRRGALQILLDGAPLSPEPGQDSVRPGTVRIPFSPAWPGKKKGILVIEYRLQSAATDAASPPASPSSSAVTSVLALEPQGWYPVLRERKGLFGGGGESPEKWDLRITVPRNFLVHASGQGKGEKRRGDLVEHRFRQRTGRDFDPFIIAGRFHDEHAAIRDVTIHFWTRQPLPPGHAQQAAAQLSPVIRFYESAFGPRGEMAGAIWVVEAGADAPRWLHAAHALPRVALVQEDADPSRRSWLAPVEHALADTWFGDFSPAEFDELLPMDAVANYAMLIAEELRRDGSRDGQLRRLLAGYDRRRAGLEERSVLSVARGRDPAALQPYYDKSVLFIYALEDRYGRDALHRALARLVRSLHGRAAGSNDLRAALKLETGEDPQEFFRQWLNQPGIPEEFRNKYGKQVAGDR